MGGKEYKLARGERLLGKDPGKTVSRKGSYPEGLGPRTLEQQEGCQLGPGKRGKSRKKKLDHYKP